MTPDLLTLARAYMALPGAPVRDMSADELAVDGYRAPWRQRDGAGILWAPDNGGSLPDLTDDATGGVLLGMLPASRTVEMDPDIVSVVVFTGAGHAGGKGATLAEAVARVAVALGRAR
jgi:hypothetical protein